MTSHLYVKFPHALGLKALLRHWKSAFHYLELLSTQAAAWQSRAPRCGTYRPRTDARSLSFCRDRIRGHARACTSIDFRTYDWRSYDVAISKIIQAVKLSVSRRLAISGEFSGRFWQSRFYDFNLWGQQKEVEKLKYMHRNPVVRGLVTSPEDWRWSSYRSYAYGEAGLVRINDWTWWEEKIRGSAG